MILNINRRDAENAEMVRNKMKGNSSVPPTVTRKTLRPLRLRSEI